ncbi:MAG TPA: hypothetical protein VEU31_10985, partial [Candidatus Acidoferrales bacterium]|nr:hypothetical protein [Candidatus Acidoferrales bacterium]
FLKRATHFFLVLGCIFFFPFGAAAQAPAGTAAPSKEEKQERGPTLYESFEGSSNTDGQFMDLNSAAGYIFNEHFSWDLGIPIFFTRGTTSTGSKVSTNGLGDIYTDFRLAFKNPAVNYVTTLTGAAPTGDPKKGLSTGRATFDWGNNFSREFGRWTPFANLGVGNSLYNTSFFHRSFITLGKVAHFEAGTEYDLGHSVSVSALAYDVAPWGQQKVFSRLVTRTSGGAGGVVRHNRVFENSVETTGGASLVRDNGFAAALDVNPVRALIFELAYSRSVHFQLNTISFGVGMNLSSLFRKPAGH